jgi:D-alanyl-D-alanine carboxypeptidase
MRWVVGAAPSVTGSVKTASVEEPVAQPAGEAPARPVRAAAAEEPAPERKGWMIQIGATTEPGQAKALLENAASKGGRFLAAAEPFTEVYEKGSTTYYRARFAGLNEQSADAACKALKRSSVSCFAIKN